METTEDYLTTSGAAANGLIERYGARIVATRKAKGFETSYNNILIKNALVVEEVGEAISGERKGDRENVAEELADAAIRLIDILESIDFGNVNELDAQEDGPSETGVTHDLMHVVVPRLVAVHQAAKRGKPDEVERQVYNALTAVGDVAHIHGIDLEGAIRAKMDVNDRRERMHGKRF